MISKAKLLLATLAIVALEGCVETIENDYDHSSSVYGESDTREFFEKIQQNSGG